MAGEADRIGDLYQRHAHSWDQERSRSLTEKPWLDKFLSLLPPKPRILDLGCGSAQPIAQYFILQGCQVTGVDSSPALIKLCNKRFPDHNWIIADMRELSLNDRFDGILAWDSFFHLTPEDQRLMFPIFPKHAKPASALMFTSGPRYGDAIGSYKGEPLYHGSLDESEYRLLLSDHQFDVIAQVTEDPTCDYHTIWLASQRR